MRRLAALLPLIVLLACVAEPDDDSCEAGDVRCPTTRTIQHCLDEVWDEPESCPPRTGAGGLEILTYCYPDQGVCAP